MKTTSQRRFLIAVVVVAVAFGIGVGYVQLNPPSSSGTSGGANQSGFKAQNNPDLPRPGRGSSGDSSLKANSNALIQTNRSANLPIPVPMTLVDEKNVPLQFDVLVVDQNSAPLTDVSIRLQFRQWYHSIGGGITGRIENRNFTTGPDGRMELSGAVGDSIQIDAVEKPGYILSPNTQVGFLYTGPVPFRPEPGKPIIIRMWQKREGQPLVEHRLKRIGVPCNGSPATFDLLNGKKTTAEGDLQLAFTRTPTALPTSGKRYAWKLVLESLRGGLQEVADEFGREAPVDRYAKTLTYSFAEDDPNWTAIFERTFYVTLPQANSYGRIKLTLNTGYPGDQTGLTMDIAINPTGARIIE